MVCRDLREAGLRPAWCFLPGAQPAMAHKHWCPLAMTQGDRSTSLCFFLNFSIFYFWIVLIELRSPAWVVRNFTSWASHWPCSPFFRSWLLTTIPFPGSPSLLKAPRCVCMLTGTPVLQTIGIPPQLSWPNWTSVTFSMLVKKIQDDHFNPLCKITTTISLQAEHSKPNSDFFLNWKQIINTWEMRFIMEAPRSPLTRAGSYNTIIYNFTLG